jgi:hypothetical protein
MKAKPKKMTKKTKSRLKSKRSFSRLQVLVFAIVFAAVGGWAIYISMAAGHNTTSGTGDYVWSITQRQGSAGAIEQQPGVIYSDNCLWTIDSHDIFGGYGKLAAGTSASIGDCIIEDGTLHMVGIRFAADTPDLKVSFSFQPQDRTYYVKPVATSTGYEYLGCVIGPYISDWPSLPTVANSTGGHGLKAQITINVNNPTTRAARKVNGYAFIGNYVSSRLGICAGTITEPFDDAGAVWQTGL